MEVQRGYDLSRVSQKEEDQKSDVPVLPGVSTLIWTSPSTLHFRSPSYCAHIYKLKNTRLF